MASAGNDKVIRIWDTNHWRVCSRDEGARESGAQPSRGQRIRHSLVSGGYDTDIRSGIWRQASPCWTFPRWHQSWVLSAKSDYRRIISTGQDRMILVMDFGAGVKGSRCWRAVAEGDPWRWYVPCLQLRDRASSIACA